MEKKLTPCGGCGEADPINRCIGCFHPFESTPVPEPKIETVTWLNLADHFTEDWEIMHCRYADDKRKLDTDLFELSDGWLVKKGGTGKLELHEVEYMTDQLNPDLLKVMQDAEATKESDLKKVKEEVGKCPECGAPCKLIDRTYQEEIHDVHYTEHVYQPPAEAEWGKGAVWVTGQYDRLYDQLKAEPNKRIACFVDYNWYRENPAKIARDICTIRGETMEFVSRGRGYGMVRNMKGDEKTNLISLCEEMRVQWLDESGEKDEWISVDDQLPTEGGRYWCYVEEVNDLGISHFQWNCCYHDQEKRWSDNFLSMNVTHWQHLPPPPIITP